jgi:hypothetical protein
LNESAFLDIRLIILLVVTLPMGFVTLLLTVRAWRSQQRVNAARSRQSAPGTVIAARVEQVNIPVRVQTSTSTYRLATRYAPVVAYAYFVNGTYLQGGRLRLGPRVLSSEAADAGREITRYPVGSPVTVWYDPQNPVDAVLERGGGAVWIEWLICGLMLALTVLAAVLIYG